MGYIHEVSLAKDESQNANKNGEHFHFIYDRRSKMKTMRFLLKPSQSVKESYKEMNLRIPDDELKLVAHF